MTCSCVIQTIWAQHTPIFIYSASAVDRATELYFFEFHETKECPRNWQYPYVYFGSTLYPAQYAFEYPMRLKFPFLGYYKLVVLGSCKISKDSFDSG